MNRYAICLATALTAVCLPRAYAQNGRTRCRRRLSDRVDSGAPRQSAADVPAAVTVITAGCSSFGIPT
jgi:hypothetical protein